MTFKQDTSVDCVDLSDSGNIDVINKTVEKKMKVPPTRGTGVYIMVWSNSIKIGHCRFHSLEEGEGFSFRNRSYFTHWHLKHLTTSLLHIKTPRKINIRSSKHLGPDS